jgi:hypothetical protein
MANAVPNAALKMLPCCAEEWEEGAHADEVLPGL